MSAAVRNLSAVALAAFLGCTGSAEKKDTKVITLGAVIDQSSTMAWSTWTPSGNLAVTQLNQALDKTSSSARIKLIVSDSAATPATAVAVAQDLVANQSAKAVITDTSADNVALAKLAYDADPNNNLDVPVVCVTCTSASINNVAATDPDAEKQAALRDLDQWNWRTCTRQTEQLTVLKAAVTGQGTNGDVTNDNVFKVAVIVLDDASGHPFVQSILNQFAAINPNVVVEKIAIPTSTHDLTDTAFWDQQAARLMDNVSDCVQSSSVPGDCSATSVTDGFADALMENLNPGYNIALSQALARANNNIAFFHAHAFRANQVYETLRSAINGQRGVSPVLYDESEPGRAFADALRAASGTGPTLLDANMYDAVAILGLVAIAASRDLEDPSQVTGTQLRDAMRMVSTTTGEVIGTGAAEFEKGIKLLLAGTAINYEGASGPVDFDAGGDIVQRLSLYEGQDSVFVDIQKFDCVSSLTCPAMQ